MTNETASLPHPTISTQTTLVVFRWDSSVAADQVVQNDEVLVAGLRKSRYTALQAGYMVNTPDKRLHPSQGPYAVLPTAKPATSVRQVNISVLVYNESACLLMSFQTQQLINICRGDFSVMAGGHISGEVPSSLKQGGQRHWPCLDVHRPRRCRSEWGWL